MSILKCLGKLSKIKLLMKFSDSLKENLMVVAEVGVGSVTSSK